MAGCRNIGLWSQAFKQYKCANYVHLVCMGIVTIITWMSGFLAIIYFGTENEAGNFHTGLGIAILAIITLEAIGGIVCFSLQKSSRVRPDLVALTNSAHHFLGYICLILVLIQLLAITRENEPKLFIPIIVISLVSYVAFLLYKFFKPRMQKYAAIPDQDDKSLPLIKNQRDLAQFNGEYFIFADKVYDINKVITNHPGGNEVINQIRKREVDRFIYGSEAIESLEHTKVHEHTAGSISLAGDPIGIMANSNLYNNMGEINDVIVEKVAKPCKSKFMCAPYLISAKSSQQFEYAGFQDLSQLGKYLAVTINGRKTRLYSIVNFLQEDNIALMNKIFGRSLEQKQFENFNSNQDMQTNMRVSNVHTNPNARSSIPLLIKKYDKGEFTQKFLNGVFKDEVKISRPRGRGLMLHDIPAGNVILFAGGTGLNPYCDLIDQLFKEFLVSSGSPHSGQIQSFNPLVSQKALTNKFKFTLYLSVQDIGEIHEITAVQLNQLCKNGVMNVNLRVNQNRELVSKNFPNIHQVNERFQHFLPQISTDIDRISHIFICGPPVMGMALVKNMAAANIPRHKYTVL